MQMLEIIEKLLLKNRTIVSADFEQCLSLIAKEIPLNIHRYPTDKEYGTWVIPPQWDVKKAYLSDGEQKIASYEDHPLFLAPYSHSFTGWIEREELMKHIRSQPSTPDVYFYEHRLAYDYRRRLKEWLISLPHRIVETLDKPKYYIDIQVETKPGHMLVGESVIKGQHNTTFAFLTHLCHIGQANDGVSGVAVGMELIKKIKEEFPNPNYNYQLLITPEVIGSVAYLHENSDKIDSYLSSVFIEMVGIKKPIRYGLTRRGDTYTDRIFQHVLRERKVEFSICPFTEHWGNDELIFDSPGCGIPGGSIERFPFEWYHTSGDNMSVTHESSLKEMVEVLLDVVRVLESDFIPQPKDRIPIYLTRYNLYADYVTERSQYDTVQEILSLFWEGLSVFDIAKKLNRPYKEVGDYVSKFKQNELIQALPLTPNYFRFGPNSKGES